MTAEQTPISKKLVPSTIGFAVIADLSFWGALLIYIPSFFGFGGGWKTFFYILGFIFLIISFAGTLTELGKFFKSEALSYWGASLIFLIPAYSLYIAIIFEKITGMLIVLAKIVFMLLIAIGWAMVFHGMPYLFWKKNSDDKNLTEETTSLSFTEDNKGKKREKRKINLEIVANIIVALLTLTTAIVTLLDKLFSK